MGDEIAAAERAPLGGRIGKNGDDLGKVTVEIKANPDAAKALALCPVIPGRSMPDITGMAVERQKRAAEDGLVNGFRIRCLQDGRSVARG